MSVVSLLRQNFEIEWRQQDCIEKIKQAKHHSNRRIIAFEDPKFKPGCRKFIATEMREFYLWYKQCPAELRHFYEIIMESTPCRLYFDLEFLCEINRDLDGVALVKKFCQIACKSLNELLGIQLDPDRHFLILDSTCITKFSAHVIVHIPEDIEAPYTIKNERLFPDNICLKQVATFICSKLLQENCCLVNKGNENKKEKGFICDLSVYSKNRNFRLYQSSKCGKPETLQLHDFCNFYKSRSGPIKNAQIFVDSLVIPFNYDKRELLVVDNDNIPNLHSFLETSKKLLNGQNVTAIADPNRSMLRERQNSVDMESVQANRPSIITKELARGSPPSPFPRLDDHMLNKIFKKFNEAAEIRVWCLICCYEEEGKELQQNETKRVKTYHLQYQLTNSRYCLSRGREHRRQNVYWTVGLSVLNIVQRCWDKIDCPNYVSPPYILQKEMCEYIQEAIDGVFRSLGIPTNDFVLPDPEGIMNHDSAEEEPFNPSAEWMQKLGSFNFLQLQFPPPDESAPKKRRIEEEEGGSNNTNNSSDDPMIILD